MDPEIGHHDMGLVLDLRTVSDIWRDQVLEEATHLAAGNNKIKRKEKMIENYFGW